MFCPLGAAGCTIFYVQFLRRPLPPPRCINTFSQAETVPNSRLSPPRHERCLLARASNTRSAAGRATASKRGSVPSFTRLNGSFLVTTTLCATGYAICAGLPPPHSHAYAALMQSLVTPSGKLLLRIFGPTTSLPACSCPSGWIATTLCYLRHNGPRWPDFLGIRHALMTFLSHLGYSAESCGYCKDASTGRRTSNSRTWMLSFASALQMHSITRA